MCLLGVSQESHCSPFVINEQVVGPSFSPRVGDHRQFLLETTPQGPGAQQGPFFHLSPKGTGQDHIPASVSSLQRTKGYLGRRSILP